MKKFKHKKTGEIATYKDGVLKSSGFAVEIGVEPSQEFWELIVEKEYEILSFSTTVSPYSTNNKLNNGLFAFTKDLTYDGGIKEEWLLTYPDSYNIHSVKRLSDGEIFTIGDKIIHTNNVTNKIGAIKEFHILSNNIWFNTDEYDIPLCYVSAKVKQPLFTTEDGVDIFEGNIFYILRLRDFNIMNESTIIAKDQNMFQANKLGYFYYSTKEAAEEYILMNKPCFSIKDICPLIGKSNNITYVDLDYLTRLLKELVKSKL